MVDGLLHFVPIDIVGRFSPQLWVSAGSSTGNDMIGGQVSHLSACIEVMVTGDIQYVLLAG